ncbi:GTPase HflX [bacterium HR19]|nr:GTPase HflX [bacterium HR19]
MDIFEEASSYQGKRFAVATVLPKFARKNEIQDKLESFDEFKELIKNLGGKIEEEIIQKRERPDPSFFIGKGKAKELALKENIDVIAFDSILKTSQISNLREITKKEVVDREYVIIRIFAERATTREGKLQVELAELKYKMAKLIGIGKEMSQLGGVLGTRGPGETKTEELKRHMLNRIRAIEKEIEDIRKTRFLHRERRKKEGFITFSLVGYTNVGKSTLLKTLSGEDVIIKDQLFTTLETRVGKLKENNNILLSDTVGFIRNLPHSLIAAFKSTLEEVIFSDALLIVLDISSDYEKQYQTIRDVLDEIQVDKSKPYIIVFNKIDLVPKERLITAREKFQEAIFISAIYKIGIDDLKEKIIELAGKIEKGEIKEKAEEEKKSLIYL